MECAPFPCLSAALEVAQLSGWQVVLGQGLSAGLQERELVAVYLVHPLGEDL